MPQFSVWCYLSRIRERSGDVIFSMWSTGRLQVSLIYMLDLVTVERQELSYCDSQRKWLNGKIACVFNTLRAVMQNWMATASMLLLIYQKNTTGSDIIGQNLTSFIFWSARKNKSYSRRYLHELWTVWDKYTNISFLSICALFSKWMCCLASGTNSFWVVWAYVRKHNGRTITRIE